MIRTILLCAFIFGIISLPVTSVVGTSAGNAIPAGTTSQGVSANMPRTLASPNAQLDGHFGYSSALNGKLDIVGAPFENVSGLTNAGHAYVFGKNGSLASTLVSGNAQKGGLFGSSVALGRGFVAVGARGETANGKAGAGAVYLFNDTSYSLIRKLVSPNAQQGGGFGWSVAAVGRILVVGAPQETVGGDYAAGDSYVFNASSGALISSLSSPNVQSEGFFGWSVAVSGSIVMVGAFGESSNGVMFSGHVYLFRASTGKLISTLSSPDTRDAGEFGISVALTSSTWVVGAPQEPAGGLSGSGSAYVFNASTSRLTAALVSPHSHTNGRFGTSVSVSSSGTIVVGAPGEPSGGKSAAGRAYWFSGAGALLKSRSSPNAQQNGGFGVSVAISGRRAAVGAPEENENGTDQAGHEYLFG
jgi:hypothetical protein